MCFLGRAAPWAAARPRAVRAACCCLWLRWCSGRRRARSLCVPVGGGPPASRPRCELRSARRLEARPGPAAAHRHRGRSLRCPPHRRRCVAGVWLGTLARSPARPRRRPSNFARNSPANISNHEFVSLEFQRFWALLTLCAIELRATFLGVVTAVTRRSPLETFTLVWSVVLLCLLLLHPACIRYKVHPAWLVGGDSGRKFAMRG